ncbi:sensor histidine kinase [Pseudoflavonifractor sp. 524-17]|uniref:sensor histidine kinase n=1 Tax=Pseudoflavonifractor sp. 524-17 TaxID=2304577 RepID=UPI0013799020|nr:HAMP domain-containing sensor histidine kinase [Pseudoflavonifractor sp. 524-17]NCE66082.1 sensor histidine kinase [Pseudoflavonifractor sp. 524-17]
MGGVLLSFLAAVLVFALFGIVGSIILERTVYGRAFTDQMADSQFSALQKYVEQEAITPHNLHRLNAWCSRGDQVYLTVYIDGVIRYESPIAANGELEDEDFDISFESPDREYALRLNDGTQAQAFLYYYAGDTYHYWAMGLSGLLAFAAFSVCFILFVHWKLRYVKQLKGELDILAGGDLHYAVTVKGEDELGELAKGIEQMRRSILTHQETEEQMRSANSQLVTAMSHDLRTPLTSLLAYLELMERGKYDSEEQLQHFTQRSLEKCLQIKSMADKLFAYFLVYSYEWETTEVETADADSLFQQFWGEYAFSLENSGFTVHCAFEELQGALRVNMELLRRAFDNLYSNLLKYADPTQPIEISYGRKDGQVRLTLLNHISPQRDKRESTSIGLSTCRRVLQHHGGSFETKEDAGIFQVGLALPLG